MAVTAASRSTLRFTHVRRWLTSTLWVEFSVNAQHPRYRLKIGNGLAQDVTLSYEDAAELRRWLAGETHPGCAELGPGTVDSTGEYFPPIHLKFGPS